MKSITTSGVTFVGSVAACPSFGAMVHTVGSFAWLGTRAGTVEAIRLGMEITSLGVILRFIVRAGAKLTSDGSSLVVVHQSGDRFPLRLEKHWVSC